MVSRVKTHIETHRIPGLYTVLLSTRLCARMGADMEAVGGHRSAGLSSTSLEDQVHISTLLVPLSFIDSPPPPHTH